MKRVNVLAACAVVMWVGAQATAFASEPVGLTQFQAGNKAKAAEVNANFNILSGAVTDNHNRLTAAETTLTDVQAQLVTGGTGNSAAFVQLQTDVSTALSIGNSNGAAITGLQTDVAANANDVATALSGVNANSAAIANLGGSVPGGLALPIQVLLDNAGIGAMVSGGWALSPTGYLFSASNPNIQNGDFNTVALSTGNVGYTTTNCTGPAYMVGGDVPPFAGANGFVIEGANLSGNRIGQALMVAPMTVPETLRIESFGAPVPNFSCQANPNAGLSTGWPLVANNPAVSGVAFPMTGTLTLGWP